MARPLEFVFHGSNLLDEAESGCRRGVKRAKYAAQACQACKRRKVKCSGHEPCQNCRSRGTSCNYGGDHAHSLSADPDDEAAGLSAAKTAPWSSQPTENETQASTTRHISRANTSDARFDEMNDRIKSLEQKLNHVLEGSKDNVIVDSPLSDVQLMEQPTFDADDQDNLFTSNAPPTDDLSLSGHVAAMRALLSRPASPQPKDIAKMNSRNQMLVSLPDPPALNHLLDVYFNEMEGYYPFLERAELEPRIYEAIRTLGYSASSCIVLVPPDRLSLLALICVMLALAECVDSNEGAKDKETRSGWKMYLQGCRAARRSFHSRIIDLDAIRAQTLTAAYLMQLELLLAASHTISVAHQLATSFRLHNENSWPELKPAEVLTRKRLWWTLYELDRRIAQKCGAPYHIQESEFSMSDFKDEECAASMDLAYLQALIRLARLWGQVWDGLFAVNAITKCKDVWLTVEIMDTQILNARRQIPPELMWQSREATEYVDGGGSIRHLRRCLYLYTRLELLRMLIRQNLLRPGPFNPDTAHHCARLAREVIGALSNFVAWYPFQRAFGYFCTSSAVECAYHLIPVLRESTDQVEQAASMTALHQARGILEQLGTKLNVAKKALRALRGVLTRWGSGTTVSDGFCRTTEQGSVASGEAPPMSQLDADQINFDWQAGIQDGLSPDEWLSLPMGACFGGEFDFHAGP